jgi:predicted nucleic acid-binding protein
LEQRTRLLMQMGFGNFDALHVASAEATAADVFSTCDDRLLKAAMNVRDALRVRVVGVVELATEVLA